MAKKFIQLKREIIGIKDIEETVEVLEKIAASGVHDLKIINQTMADYEFSLREIFLKIGEGFEFYPFFKKLSSGRHLKIILTTERGLCGGLLNNLVGFFEKEKGKNDDVFIVGARGKKLFQERGLKFSYFLNSWDEIPKKEKTKAFEDLIISWFLKRKYSQISVFYSSFESLAIQKPRKFEFLPFDLEEFKKDIGWEKMAERSYSIYEPSQEEVINYLIKEYLSLALFQKILEAKLSEISARTVTMGMAGEKAKKIISHLARQYFRTKREVGTNELNNLYSHRINFSFIS